MNNELPGPETLREFLEVTTCSTYPVDTLKRRVKLLTAKEKERCDKLWGKIEDLGEKIDEIISIRAEKEQDPWP
jgi:hypothetical protein